MAKTHWKKLTNPDYLGAYALEPGEDLVATIKTVRREIVTGAEGRKEECSVIYFCEKVKPLILNATNSKTIQRIYGTPYIEDWEGKQIQLFVEHNIKFGRDLVDGLRIRPFIPKEIKADAGGTVICEQCGNAIAPYKQMDGAQVARYTYQKYGRALCAGCAEHATVPGKAVDVLK